MRHDYKLLFSETVKLAVEHTVGEYFVFGQLTYTIQSDGRHVYIFDVDPEKFDEALALAGEEMFPGFDPDNGWVQRHDKEIPFLYERTYNYKRPDLADVLKPWGMSVDTYNKWKLLKITKGVHLRDRWRVLSN